MALNITGSPASSYPVTDYGISDPFKRFQMKPFGQPRGVITIGKNSPQNITEIGQKSIKVLHFILNMTTVSSIEVQKTEFGDQTEKIVKEFQKNNNLPVTGLVDELTWKALVEVFYSQE